MAKHSALLDILYQFQEKGYKLADSQIAVLPPTDIQSNDWRLDNVQKVGNPYHRDTPVIVIAVSSKMRNMKLLFVEVLFPDTPFSPVQLLKRLFPSRSPQRVWASMP